MTTRRIVGMAGAGVLALGFFAVGLTAQTDDERWFPWVGCWEAGGGTADDPMLCFRPSADGVEVLTIQDGAIESVQTLRADGRSHPVEAEGCSGTESVAFSDDGARIYQNSRQQCAGVLREGSGILAMIGPDAWIDVKSVEVDGQATAWVSHYRAASPQRVESLGLDALVSSRRMAIETARVAASRPPDVDDVIEATGRVHDEAVRAWIAEAAEPDGVAADELVRLADAGVSPDVIDVVVAVNYPEHFTVGQDAAVAEAEAGRRASAYRASTRRARMCTPFLWDPFYSSFLGYHDGCGLAYGARFGYGLGDPYRYGSPYPYYGYRPGPIVIVPREDENDDARVINGRGYTRGGTSTTTPSTYRPPSRPSTRSGTPATVSRGSGASAGSSTGTTRRAKPRGGGGGGL